MRTGNVKSFRLHTQPASFLQLKAQIKELWAHFQAGSSHINGVNQDTLHRPPWSKPSLPRTPFLGDSNFSGVISFVGITHWQKAVWRGKDYYFFFAYTSGLWSIINGNQSGNSSRNLKEKPWRDMTCWLALWLPPHLILNQLLRTRTACLRNPAAHSGLCSPKSINNQYNLPQISSEANET